MMQKIEEKNESKQTSVAPPYCTPRLTVYGAIQELTASGSTGDPENNQGLGQPFNQRS
jgi:hypothetical protein